MKYRGFTLIEALVVIAILAIVLAAAVPGMRGFVVGSKVASISNEFSSALLQTRALAVAKNSCATLCASTNPDAATGTCTDNAADNFQKGWLIFVNPACNENQTKPADAGGTLTVVRRAESDGYSITREGGAKSIVMFDPRGLANLTATGRFQVTAPSGADDSTRRTICIDTAGRATVRKYTTADC